MRFTKITSNTKAGTFVQPQAILEQPVLESETAERCLENYSVNLQSPVSLGNTVFGNYRQTVQSLGNKAYMLQLVEEKSMKSGYQGSFQIIEDSILASGEIKRNIIIGYFKIKSSAEATTSLEMTKFWEYSIIQNCQPEQKTVSPETVEILIKALANQNLQVTLPAFGQQLCFEKSAV